MTTRTRLPTIVMGRSMSGDAPTKEDPEVKFELEAETGEIFDVKFSLRGILSTVVLAHGWTILKKELAELDRPTIVMSTASTEFLNIDIDLRGDADDVAGLLKMVEPSVVVLNHIGIDASIELARQFTSLDTTMLEIIGLVEALPPEAKKVWSRLKYRRANIGIQTGAKPAAKKSSKR
jgi:hypothetical protein